MTNKYPCVTNGGAWRVDLGVFAFLAVFFLVVYEAGQALTPFVFAALFAYALNPAVGAMVKRKVPRGAAVGLFVTVFLLLITAVIVVVVYVIQMEVVALIDNMPSYIRTIDTKYLPVIQEKFHVRTQMNLLDIWNKAKERLMTISPESMSQVADYVASFISGTLGFFLALFNVILVPVLMAYILMDYDKMKAGIVGYLPVPYRENILCKMGEVEKVLRDFVKGQLLVAIIMGVLYCIGLFFIGIDMPVLVGMVSGLLNMVPYLGTTLGIIVAVALSVLKFHDLTSPAMVLVLFAVVQGLEGYLITPKVVGDRLGLHPLAIFLALVVFGELMGFVGILLAVPLAAVLKVFVVGFLRDYKASKLFEGEGA